MRLLYYGKVYGAKRKWKTFNFECIRQSYKKEEPERGNLKLPTADKFKLKAIQI